MADPSGSDAAAAATAKPTYHAVAVGLHEAALDSPTFRATAAHYADQIDAIEKWLSGYVASTSKLTHDVLALEETINTYLSKTVPSNAEAIIENDYTFLALKRVGDGSRECLMQLLGSMKRMESTVVEPVRLFLVGDLRNFKEIRKSLEQTQRTFDSTLARYASQSKTKEPSALREDAFAVYETRKAYLQASMDFCQLAPQVRFTMDQLLVKVSGEIWKEMKRSRDAATNATRWDSEMDRLRGWSKEMDVAESVLRRELQIARRDLGDDAMTGCKPSRELEDYSTSTVPFLGSRGPLNMQTKDGAAVISEKQGWLFLRTVSGKPARHNWVRRWYYCRDGVFGWMIPGPQGVLQGDEIGVLLCNARPAVGEERRFCFEVKTKSLTLMLQAEGQNELTEWLEVFEVTKKKAFESSMDRDSNALPGGVDPAFNISPPSIPEFSARTLDAQLGLVDDSTATVERSGTLPVPGPDPGVAGRASFDVNGTLTRRSFTALGRDLAREDGESGREHAARIIQKLDLHRKATFGAGAEAAIASSSGSAGSIAGLMAASHNLSPNMAGGSRKGTHQPPSMDSHPGTLAPLTLAPPPTVTTLSRTAVLTSGGEGGSGFGGRKVLPSVMANYWGTNVWGALTVPADPVLPRLNEDDPIGVVVEEKSNTTLVKAEQDKRVKESLPLNYPPELRAQHAQFRLLFPHVESEEKLVLVFRAAWQSTAAPKSKGPVLLGDGRIYVTLNNMYFYSRTMGLVTAYSLSLDMIMEVTAAPGRDSDSIFLHLDQNANDTGYSRITIKVFLDDIRVLHTRLNLLVDNLQAEEPMELEEIVSVLINVEREEYDRPSPSAESWEEVSENTPVDDGTLGGRPVFGRRGLESNPRLLLPSSFRTSPKFQLPSHPVIFEPEDMKEMAAERHFETSAKSCFHVLFGDKSFVFPKLYFERRAQQIAQGPWVQDDQGRLRREFQFKVDHTDLLGRSKTMDIIDYQVIDVHSDHVTYVVTHVKTAWHLPHSNLFKLVTKTVITHVGKSKCKLAIYTRIDWSKSPPLSKNLIERQALHDIASDADELAELATDQIRKLGPRSRTNRAIQVYGLVGQQTQVVVFSPAATDASKKQVIKPRTITALVWETVRSFGESAISSLIMWAFAGLRKLFEVVTAQRLILGILAFSTLTNLYLSSNEVTVWWKERRAASFMRSIGVGPNTMMSKAIYMTDLAEATRAPGQNVELFPHNSTCFAGFEEILSATDMSSPWEDAGASFSAPTTRSTARRLRRTRQRLGSYRHDLLVAMRVVNSVEREILQSEWENWLINEKTLCDDLGMALQVQGEKTRDDDESNASQTTLGNMSKDRREALEGWREKYCGSCQDDYRGMLAQRRHTEL
jgi:hypothetical protein